MDKLSLQKPLKKNDTLFMRLADGLLPCVHVYCEESIQVVHGPSCRQPGQEINVKCCAADNVPIVARRGGGGTVVLSPGMAITLVVGRRRRGDSVQSIFSHIHRAMIDILEKATGISLDEKGTSDLAVGELKVLGSSLYLSNNPFLYCYQSSLMVEPDIRLIGKYLLHPPKEPPYRDGRNHDLFCTTLKQNGCALSCREIVEVIGGKLAGRLKVSACAPLL